MLASVYHEYALRPLWVTGMASYRLRQNPGPGNALGTLKIVFPNQYSVYMHDTPNHHLFERSERAFSHGCIRMSTPATQAAIVHGGEQSGWTEDRIAEIVDSGKRTVIRLDQPMPVHLTYQDRMGRRDRTHALRPGPVRT